MRWEITSDVESNTFDYFERTKITNNGFREYDARWLVPEEINPNGFVVLGRAYGAMMQQRLNEGKVVIGHDYRSYSQELSRSFIIGLLSTGVHVIDVGLCLSPMVYFAQHHFRCKAGIMITASHNDNGWTGVKLADGFSSTFGPEGIQAYKEFVHASEFPCGSGRYESFDGLYELYRKDILERHSLSHPFRIVLAAGNGTAGRFAPGVLRGLGCEVLELDCTPDWNFPKHNPNPEDVAFLRDISEEVLTHDCDLGIGIDGDGDRIGIVDNHGKEVFSDKLGLLVARKISKEHPHRKIVIDVKSTGLFYDDPLLRSNGTDVVTWKTGHSYMKQKVREENAIAGFEKSGHWFFNEPYGRGYDDAILSAVHLLHLLDEVNRPLAELVEALPKTWQSPTLGPFCADTDKYDVVKTVTESYKEEQAAGKVIGGRRIDNLVTVNGVRFVFNDGSWGLVRASSNKPSLVVVAESRSSEEQLHDIIDDIKTRLERTGKVGEYDQAMPPRPFVDGTRAKG